MSGHSKWSKIKHQKESTDAVKGKTFTKLASAIIIAVKEGGDSDPNSNFRLRLAIEKAREANVPKENIERAIEKGGGSAGEAGYEKVVYEAYGPSKVGIIIEAATDNHQRTTSDIKNILDKHGGRLAAQGSVSYLFTYLGMLKIARDNKSFDEMMNMVIEAGGEDLQENKESYFIYTKPMDLHKVKQYIYKKGLRVEELEFLYKPTLLITLDSIEKERVLTFVRFLEQYEDVHKVYTNLEI